MFSLLFFGAACFDIILLLLGLPPVGSGLDRMDGWMDGCDGRMDGRDGWMDGGIDWMDAATSPVSHLPGPS